jgi:hypothetical protein
MLETEYYTEFFRVLETLNSPISKADYTFETLLKEYQSLSEIGLITSMFVLPIIMAERDDVPDYDTADMSTDDFKVMAGGVMNSKSAGKIKVRFVDIVEEMIAAGVL